MADRQSSLDMRGRPCGGVGIHLRVQGERLLRSLACERGERVGMWRSMKYVWHRRTSSEEVGGAVEVELGSNGRVAS